MLIPNKPDGVVVVGGDEWCEYGWKRTRCCVVQSSYMEQLLVSVPDDELMCNCCLMIVGDVVVREAQAKGCGGRREALLYVSEVTDDGQERLTDTSRTHLQVAYLFRELGIEE